MDIGAIIQARRGSKRLPDKIMKPLSGKPILWHVVERVSYSKLIDGVVVATTTNRIDDIVDELCKKNNFSLFRGSEDDVLDRYYQCAKEYNIKNIVRITADCPLIDPNVIDIVIQYFLDNKFDYVSNRIEPTYPDGLDVEVFSYETLEKTWKETTLPSDREHVTTYIENHPERFKISNVKQNIDLSYLRWTVDYKKDLEVVKEIYKKLYSKKHMFLMEDVLQLLEKRPKLNKINAGIQRNEGILLSKKNDKIVKR
jgi:spore coat polysaccharide biosynthesis protein SpsF